MSEIIFRISVAALLFLSGITRGYYELQYARLVLIKTYRYRREKFFVRMVGLFLTIPTVTYIFSEWIDFAAISFPFIIRVAATTLMFVNYLYFVWIHRELGRNWSPVLAISKDQELITTGPYKYIRHPMYASILIHAFLMLPVSANWLIGLTGIVPFAVVYLIRVSKEEEMMAEQFGERYTTYMKKTGRLLPRLF